MIYIMLFLCKHRQIIDNLPVFDTRENLEGNNLSKTIGVVAIYMAHGREPSGTLLGPISIETLWHFL